MQGSTSTIILCWFDFCIIQYMYVCTYRINGTAVEVSLQSYYKLQSAHVKPKLP